MPQRRHRVALKVRIEMWSVRLIVSCPSRAAPRGSGAQVWPPVTARARRATRACALCSSVWLLSCREAEIPAPELARRRAGPYAFEATPRTAPQSGSGSRGRMIGMSAFFVLVVAFVAGSIPFSNLAARMTRGVDLRTVGTGTVSGTSLFRVSGFGALAVAGVLDVGKGALGPALAGDRATLAALAGGLAVIGHNWSPFLRGAGGRGVAPALGALLVQAWPGAILLLGGLVVGKAFRETGLGGFVAEVLLTPALALLQGAAGALTGVTIAVPMLVKRVAGNGRPARRGARAYVTRLLYDRERA